MKEGGLDLLWTQRSPAVDYSRADEGESQPRNKRDRLTGLCVNNRAENGAPQLQNKRGKNIKEDY